MKALALANPEFTGFTRPNSGEQIVFDCPVCPPEAKHRLAAAFANPIDGGPAWPHHAVTWLRDGEDPESLTLRPSINYPGHWHGFIDQGRIVDHSELVPSMVCGPNGERMWFLPPIRLKST